MSWEDVPANGELAWAGGYALGDCPHPPGSPEETRWRIAWFQREATSQMFSGQIRANSLAAAATVPVAYRPTHTEADDLIEAMAHVDEPDPEPKPEWYPLRCAVWTGWHTVVPKDFQGLRVMLNYEKEESPIVLSLPLTAKPRPGPGPGLPQPKPNYCARVQWSRSPGPQGIADPAFARMQVYAEKRVKAHNRDAHRNLLRLTT